jgi:hypothetical protein
MGTFCPDGSDKVSERLGQTVRTIRTNVKGCFLHPRLLPFEILKYYPIALRLKFFKKIIIVYFWASADYVVYLQKQIMSTKNISK